MKTKIRLLLPAFLIFAVIVGACIGGWLWYDSHVDRSGWAEKDGIRFYQDFHADPWAGWLTLEEGCLKLTPAAPAKSTSGKVYLNVKTEEWAIPAQVTLAIKNTYKQPSVKLDVSSVTVAKEALMSKGVTLRLKCGTKGITLEKLNVKAITAPEGYRISGFRVDDGTFLLQTEEGFQSGKIALEISFRDTGSVVTVPLTVKTAASF